MNNNENQSWTYGEHSVRFLMISIGMSKPHWNSEVQQQWNGKSNPQRSFVSYCYMQNKQKTQNISKDVICQNSTHSSPGFITFIEMFLSIINIYYSIFFLCLNFHFMFDYHYLRISIMGDTLFTCGNDTFQK